MKREQMYILGGGAVVAYFLLQKPKPGQQPNALQKLLNPTASAATKKPATAAGYAGSGQAGGGAQRPTTTNLATNYGRAALPAQPSLQGYGSNPIPALIGGFSNLAGSILRAVTGQAPRVGTAPIAGAAPKPPSVSGGAVPSGGSSGGGASRPGSSPLAWPSNVFGGPSTVSGNYNAGDFVGINPNTGLYDPAYDPTVRAIPADTVIDPSQLPGYTPVLDENGYAIDGTSAIGVDPGTSQYQAVGGNLSGPDDNGYYYYPDGSIAYGYGEAQAPSFDETTAWGGGAAGDQGPVDFGGYDYGGGGYGDQGPTFDPTNAGSAETPQPYDLGAVDASQFGAVDGFSNVANEDVSWAGDQGGAIGGAGSVSDSGEWWAE